MNEKYFLKSGTFWWNALSFGAAVLALPQVTALIPAKYMPFILMINAVVNLALRTFYPPHTITFRRPK